MKSKSKVTFLIASVITAILLAVSVIIVGFSFGWFTDSKGADVTIKIGAIKNTVTSSDEISPADFVACNYFEKTITIKVESDFEVYLRTYAKVSMQTKDGERTDLVSLIDVSKSKIGEDNKYYYTNSTSSPVTINGTLTLSLTFRFYVDSSVSNELFTNSNGTLNENLKTTITYYYEYCQKEGYDSWASNLKTTDGHKYVVSFNANGGTSDYRSKLLKYNETFSALPNATKEGYTFDGWYTEDGTHIITTTIYTYTTNLTLYARYTAKTYTITFVNYNGEVLKTVSAETGTMPEAPTTNPTKPSTVEYDYTFGSWSPAISKVTGDKVYTAIYNQTLKKYKITFVDEDGTTVLQAEKEYYYGETPVYNGATPTKAQDENYTYEFNGFGTITQVTGDKTYVATYRAVPITGVAQFTSEWKDLDFTTIDSSINDCTKITKIDFERNAPFGYTKSKLSLNGISVYYNPSVKTEIAFVFKGIILAPENSGELFVKKSGTTYSIMSYTSITFNNFITSNTTDMNRMFYNCQSLTNLDLSNFNTTNVTSMYQMFYNCPSLISLNVSNFNTNNVTSMYHMFYNCSSLTTLDLSSFVINLGCSIGGFLNNCTSLTTIVTPKAIDSSITIDLRKSYYINGVGTTTISKLTSSETGCTLYTTPQPAEFSSSWKNLDFTTIDSTITDLTKITKLSFEKTAPSGYTKSSLNVNGIELWYNPSVKTELAFVNAGTIYAPASCNYLFSSSATSGRLTSLLNLTFNNFDTSKTTNMSYMFAYCSSLTSLNLGGFDTSNVVSMYYMFGQCSSLTSVDVSKFDTTNVTSIDYMFAYCSSLTSLNVSSFNTSKSTGFSDMFRNCSSLTSLDISNFNTSRASTMRDMFYYCSSLTSLNLSNFDTSNVIDMYSMFAGCSKLTSLNISSFNTTKVTNMYEMFYQCSSLTSLNLSNFDTSKVTTMYEMFYNCSSLTSLNLSKFNTTNVTTMYGMFRNCSSLASLNLSNFNTSKVTDMGSMFNGCTAFTSLDLSNFNTSKVTDMRYMFYNCLSLTSLNLSNFTINSGCTVSSFLSGCTNLTKIVAPNTIDSSISITLPKTFTVSGTSTTINKLTSDYAGKTLTR